MEFFAWLEGSAFSMWVKDPATLLGYDLYLASHAIGMALVVGFSAALALRILGVASHVPLAPMEKFFPVMFVGFWINAVSGLVLFVIYPLKPITNPGFYLKIGLVILAVVCLRRLRREVFGNPSCLSTGRVPQRGKVLAGALLFVWAGAITAGRLMAYHGIANVEWQVSIAMAIVVAAMLASGWGAARVFRWAKASPAVER